MTDGSFRKEITRPGVPPESSTFRIWRIFSGGREEMSQCFKMTQRNRRDPSSLFSPAHLSGPGEGQFWFQGSLSSGGLPVEIRNVSRLWEHEGSTASSLARKWHGSDHYHCKSYNSTTVNLGKIQRKLQIKIKFCLNPEELDTKTVSLLKPEILKKCTDLW